MVIFWACFDNDVNVFTHSGLNYTLSNLFSNFPALFRTLAHRNFIYGLESHLLQ